MTSGSRLSVSDEGQAMQGREILVAVTGGIAAYKAAYLVSRLTQAGAGVSVMMTESAEKFVGPATFAALTGRSVARHSFDPDQHPLGAHIERTRNIDLFCVVPATAGFLANAAAGIADDLVSTSYLAAPCPVLVAPAMNSRMWDHPAVQRNVAALRQDGVHFVDPASGWLACRDSGAGRMAEPDLILEAISRLLPPQA